MKQAHAQYFHDIARADVKVIVDEKRGYDTLDIQFFRKDGSSFALAAFFDGKAKVQGAEVNELVAADA